MFARIWRGIVRAADSDNYLAYLRAQIIPAYGRAEGNRGVFILSDAQGELTVFLLLAFWDSRAALENFSDPQLDPDITPREFLLAFESTAAIFRLLEP